MWPNKGLHRPHETAAMLLDAAIIIANIIVGLVLLCLPTWVASHAAARLTSKLLLLGLYTWLVLLPQLDISEVSLLVLLTTMSISRRRLLLICYRVAMLLLWPQMLPSEAEALTLLYTACLRYAIAWGLQLLAEHIQRVLGGCLRLQWAQASSRGPAQLK